MTVATPSITDDGALVEESVLLAARLLADAEARRGRRERRQGRRISEMLEDPDGLEFIVALTDEVLRIRQPRRAARHLEHVVAGLRPQFLGAVDRRLLQAGMLAADRLPQAVMPLVRRRVRAELAGFVIPAENGPLGRHITRRRAEATRLNINLLGEAVLGEEEADHRLRAVLDLLGRPDVDYVSVKVSAVCSQLNIVAFDHEVERVVSRVRRLYDAALAGHPAKFVNLDMEEFRDLHLTVAAFKQLLDEDRYGGLDAGIVLQAYVPDSLGVLTELTGWAVRRWERHGGRVKVRIVKGANLAMERVEAELAGWPQATYASKAEVDANYKRMLDVVLDPANAEAMKVGVATHNLFEAAWALTVARHRGLERMVEMEMLEGMAPALAASVHDEAGGLLLYAPIAAKADNESVIAYLVRRFDENTSPDNFLRNQFSLRAGSSSWEAELGRFVTSVAARHDPTVETRRVQDRAREAGAEGARLFANEADTDWSLAANRAWIAGHLADLARPPVIPLVVGGETVLHGPLVEGFDPGMPEPAGPAYHWVRAEPGTVDTAVAAARPASAAWRDRSAEQRRDLLLAVATGLAGARGRLIAVMAGDGGKTVAEADPEVSEAIDFARYYAEAVIGMAELGADSSGPRFTPYGTVVVVPPWNFPLAIPAGGVLAALAAGNAVILKPAPETVATAWAFAEVCWRAGVPRDLLQFVSCADDPAGRHLITHPDVDAVILTGAWETAQLFLGWRPTLRLHAETSGKNAIVITATADLDNAIADLVRSAFGHAGQKCSAASLAIVEAPVYDDPRFRRQLADAVRTLRPGPATDLRTTIGPLIRAPEGPLARALTELDPGESWLVEPRLAEPRATDGNPRQWSPGVKLGVRPGSWFHLTECFGPVLGLMRAQDLNDAIALQNQPAYGLTAGIQSLDSAEISLWRESVDAGNLYVNRHITGAIVRRQPFGGWKRSVVGPGQKAGGPNYVPSLGTWRGHFEGDARSFVAAVAAVWCGDLAPADPTGLAAEANVLRHRPLRNVLLRAGASTTEQHLAWALGAAEAVGVGVELSSPVPRSGGAVLTVEDDATLITRLRSLPALGGRRPDKLRLLGDVDAAVRLAAHTAGLWVDDVGVVGHPRLEVLRWVREQALSETRHRHGDLSSRHGWPAGAPSEVRPGLR